MRSILTRREFVAGGAALASVARSQQAWAAADDWKSRWDATVTAAEKEGALNVSGPAGKIWRDHGVRIVSGTAARLLSTSATGVSATCGLSLAKPFRLVMNA